MVGAAGDDPALGRAREVGPGLQEDAGDRQLGHGLGLDRVDLVDDHPHAAAHVDQAWR